jgi:hypothetical protein
VMSHPNDDRPVELKHRHPAFHDVTSAVTDRSART